MSFIDKMAGKFGYSKANQEYIDKLSGLYKTELYTDPIEASKAIRDVKNAEAKVVRPMEHGLDDHLNAAIEINKGFPLTSTSNAMLGYEAAGSTLRKLYPNPFAPYSFVGNNHWATFRARSAFREDAFRDGFVFQAPDGVAKRKLKLIQTAFDDLDLWNKMLDMMDHVNTFGNCWIDRDRNLLGGLKGINLLLPEKIVPYMDTFGDFVIGWEYQVGGKELYLPLGAVDHIKTYNLRSFQLGSPPLAGVLTDIEADMYAAIYANMIFQKGGLIRAIVSMGNVKDSTEDVANLNPNTALDFALKVWELFQRQQGGLRGAAALTFLPNVQNVYPITNPKDMEGPYKETSDRTAIKVCNLLGISPRRLSVLNTSQYVNKAAIEDEESLDTINHRAYITDLVFQYINKVIIKQYLGIDDVEIVYSGEYSSISKNSGEFSQLLANAGARIMTVNEFRQRCLRWEALPELDGVFIGDAKFELMEAQAAQALMPPPAASKKEWEDYFQKAVGPKNPMFVQTDFGTKLRKFKLEDIRLI